MKNRFWHKVKSTKGQATVELAIVFPIVIIIAVIAVNALLYFSHCAKFDREFKQDVVTLATSMGSTESTASVTGKIKEQLNNSFQDNNLTISINSSSHYDGTTSFDAELQMRPTLFGLGLTDQVFGIELPKLVHKQKMVVEQYKLGMMFKS